MERIRTGTVPVQNLREAVWMMLFRGEAEEVQLNAEYYPLPAGFILQVTVQGRRFFVQLRHVIQQRPDPAHLALGAADRLGPLSEK